MQQNKEINQNPNFHVRFGHMLQLNDLANRYGKLRNSQGNKRVNQMNPFDQLTLTFAHLHINLALRFTFGTFVHRRMQMTHVTNNLCSAIAMSLPVNWCVT